MGTGISKEQLRFWRVFYTTARKEARCEYLLKEAGIEVFLPRKVVWVQWSDRKKKVRRPLFPNYIFAHVSELERLQVLQTSGVVRSIVFGGQLAEVDTHEIDQLRILESAPEQLIPIGLPLPAVGEHVVVKGGPLRGLEGNVLEHRGETYVVICVESVRQAVQVHVPVHELAGCEVRDIIPVRKSARVRLLGATYSSGR